MRKFAKRNGISLTDALHDLFALRDALMSAGVEHLPLTHENAMVVVAADSVRMRHGVTTCRIQE